MSRGAGLLATVRTVLQRNLAFARCAFYRRVWGMKIGRETRISMKARLDFTNPRGLHIGDYTIVTPDVHIFTHDFVARRHVDTHIGSYCFIGAKSIIMPGVRIGDHCIVGAGSVVTRDVPDNSLVAGNPARIIQSEIETGKWGILTAPHRPAVPKE